MYVYSCILEKILSVPTETYWSSHLCLIKAQYCAVSYIIGII